MTLSKKSDPYEGFSRSIVSERRANQRMNELQDERAKRSSAEKALISKYSIDVQQKQRIENIREDDQNESIAMNVRLNSYQKRALQKRLRHSEQKSNKTIRSKLQTYKTKRYESAVAAADAQIVLHTEDAGFLQAEHDLEFTTRLKQGDLKRNFLDESTARHIYDLSLDSYGPYGCKFDRSGRYSVLYGQRGHVALMDNHHLSLHQEFHVQERIRDACFLHNFSMMAVAQTNHVYIYDDMGAEIHKLDDHADPMALEFLPYHWLLASVGRSGYLKYRDTSTGEMVSTHRTRLGPCSVLRQNPSNAISHLGHANGTVTLWSPSSSQYLAKLQCHKGAPITAMAIDLSGITMVTGGADRQIKIWDLRKFQCTHAYLCDAGVPVSLDVSQRNIMGVGHAGHATFWAPDALKKKLKQPYMHHAVPSQVVETLRFRPFEDICAIGHSNGLSSIVIPGSGEPNLDTTEYNLNPFQDKKQRREAEVRALLDKLDPSMITLDPSQIGGLEESNGEVREERLRDMQLEAIARNSRGAKKQKKKKRGRSKIQTQLRRKQANVIDQQVIKLREARDREKEFISHNEKGASTISVTDVEKRSPIERTPTALKRFLNNSDAVEERVDTDPVATTRRTTNKKRNSAKNAKVLPPIIGTALFLLLMASFMSGTVQGRISSSEILNDAMYEDFVQSVFSERHGNDVSILVEDVSSGTCASLTTCENCTNTYTCHWCDHSNSCHARGSLYGCTWGSTCNKVDPPKPKENSTCAAHSSCSECALASHFCHWCEHDNACHAVGSPYGCTIGVDCYSNERCRRQAPEPLPGGFFQSSVPMVGVVILVTIGMTLIGCLTCCHYVTTNVKGAYDDLATITMAASMAPLSVVGGNNGHFYSTLEVQREEEDPLEQNEIEDSHQAPYNSTRSGSAASGHEEIESTEAIQERREMNPTHGQVGELENGQYLLLNDASTVQDRSRSQPEVRPLLHPSFNGSVAGMMEEPQHMKRLYRCCTIIYVVAVISVVFLVGISFFFYPSPPVYSVCNDAVAWKRIMTNIAELKFDASFEILLSLSNPNRLGAALDRGKGSYSFEGKQFGTFEIPPVSADAMSINDMMLIAHVSPDRQQALQLIEAYYMGKLVLDAEFQGTVRLPTFFDTSFDIHIKNIVVDVNALADRSLCHCPTWDDRKNHTIDLFPFS